VAALSSLDHRSASCTSVPCLWRPWLSGHATRPHLRASSTPPYSSPFIGTSPLCLRCASAPLRLAPLRSHRAAVLGCRQPLQRRCPPLPSASPPYYCPPRSVWSPGAPSLAITRERTRPPRLHAVVLPSLLHLRRANPPSPTTAAEARRALPSRRPARRHPAVFPPGRPQSLAWPAPSQPVDRRHGSRGQATEGQFGSCRGLPKAAHVLVRLAGGWSAANMLFPVPVVPLPPPIGPAIWFPAPCSVLEEGEKGRRWITESSGVAGGMVLLEIMSP
jgi:hypothetical protein